MEKSLSIRKEYSVSSEALLVTTTSVYLTYKYLGKDYNQVVIKNLIKETKNIKRIVSFSHRLEVGKISNNLKKKSKSQSLSFAHMKSYSILMKK